MNVHFLNMHTNNQFLPQLHQVMHLLLSLVAQEGLRKIQHHEQNKHIAELKNKQSRL